MKCYLPFISEVVSSVECCLPASNENRKILFSNQIEIANLNSKSNAYEIKCFENWK